MLTGIIEGVTFHNEENGFSVIKVRADVSTQTFAVIGACPCPAEGERLTAYGQWFIDRVHGKQFKANRIEATAPTTLEGIERFLGSGLIRSVGPKCAARLVKAFGADVFNVIENESGRLETVEGIGAERRKRIRTAWLEQREMRDLMVFLHTHKIGAGRAHRIQKIYGENTIEKIRTNPYKMAEDIDGIGFKTADDVAASLGVPKNSPFRINAGISHVLQGAAGEGHSALPYDDLLLGCVEILGLETDAITKIIREKIECKDLIQDRIYGADLIYLPALHRAESGVADALRRLAAVPPSWPEIDSAKAIGWVEGKLGYKLADAQSDAIKTILSARVSVVTGGPGVGKTTLLKALLTIIRAKNVTPLLAAPTGRAAKRMSEATGLEAKTIHRLLDMQRGRGEFFYNENNPLEGDLLIVDESSMIDIRLMYMLMRAVPDDMHVVFVGDIDQLPSVGPGSVLKDIISSDVVPVVRLTQVFRQASTSRIITAAHDINHGIMPNSGVDFWFIEEPDNTKVQLQIADLVTKRIPKKYGFNPSNDIQVLTPMHGGDAGTKALNAVLQKRLCRMDFSPHVSKYGRTYYIGDKVIQTRNNYDLDLFNGDIGFVREINEDNEIITIEFEGRKVPIDFKDLDDLTHAHAITIHKSQGSEFAAVVIPVSTQHFVMLQRNLLYTGITRGKKLVVLVGTKKAFAIGIKNADVAKRVGGLAGRLSKPPEKSNTTVPHAEIPAGTTW